MIITPPDLTSSGAIRETRIFCVACGQAVPGTLAEHDGAMYLRASCPRCDEREARVEDDAALYKGWEKLRRPNRPPPLFQTASSRGCPWDCGLCPNHQQKSCIALVEITSACDLGCPTCYADSGGTGRHRPLNEVIDMLDACVASANGKPEILQISGGEPACHPELLPILRAARARPFRHVMLNTNGLALADGSLPADELARLGTGFEVHLQFDGIDDAHHRALRGRDLLAVKRAALDALAAAGVPVTLVATLRRGLNLEGCGDLLRFALSHPAVRGLNLQCEAAFGRNPADAAAFVRVTQTGVVRALERTSQGLLRSGDFWPLSCGLACMAYLERRDDGWRPLPAVLGSVIQGNPLTTSIEDVAREALHLCACRGGDALRDLAARLPPDLVQRPAAERAAFVHAHFFHLTVISFLDAGNFDLDRACRECTHIVQSDGRKIPFSAFNTIHRNRLGGDHAL